MSDQQQDEPSEPITARELAEKFVKAATDRYLSMDSAWNPSEVAMASLEATLALYYQREADRL